MHRTAIVFFVLFTNWSSRQISHYWSRYELKKG